MAKFECPKCVDSKGSMMNIYISYGIGDDGSIAFQYSGSANCSLLNEFRAEVPECKTIIVETDKDEYFAEDAYRDLEQHLLM